MSVCMWCGSCPFGVHLLIGKKYIIEIVFEQNRITLTRTEKELQWYENVHESTDLGDVGEKLSWES